ncbi:Ankyrin repeat-containing protein BDA1 [Bienertia sinuspersici]
MPSKFIFLVKRWESTGDKWWYASPIDWAAANGHYDLVRELLRMDGNHLIKLTSLRRIRRLEAVWDDEEQFDDVAKCRCKVAHQLFDECHQRQKEGKKDKNSLIAGGYGGWLLYTAASAGDLGFVQKLLGKNPLLVFGEGEYGLTDILYAAARSKNVEVFKVVYDFAVLPAVFEWLISLEVKNRAVHAAARGGNLAVFAGALADLLMFWGNTPLHVAAYRGQLSVLEALIQASPSSASAVNIAGDTFLHMAVTGFQTPEDIVNSKNNEGRTALHLAIIGNIHSDLVQLLMSARYINVNVRDDHGLTPLDYLKRQPKSASSEILIRQLISAGGISSCKDYAVRKAFASHLKMQGICHSPGTSFQCHSTSEVETRTPDNKKLSPLHNAAKRLKTMFHWSLPKRKDTVRSKTVKEKEEGLCSSSEETPIPLRERYSNASSSLSSNKRTLAARSNISSPTNPKETGFRGDP